MTTTSAERQLLTVTLALAADAMFVIALLAAGRVLPANSPGRVDGSLLVAAALALAAWPTGRWIGGALSLIAAVWVVWSAAMLSHDIDWLLRWVLAVHFLVSAVVPIPAVRAFVCGLALLVVFHHWGVL